ncbi:hypothetical protein HPB48_022340 [Haemaphysalis longicornis]|uniref:DDE-1 domain-containing protein n=1 Tax=Haemaphysalis longicornis TaxID=44386 RepID=A0A9J6FBM2_HAELO|nr:hypothetical protein HPB48_022340 [Haemaphysalis longicornis]
MDNCSANHTTCELDNIELKFLPPNTTARLQPLDHSTKSFKVGYRRRLLDRLLMNLRVGTELKVDQLGAIHMMTSAWNRVKQSVANCFRKAGFVTGPNIRKLAKTGRRRRIGRGDGTHLLAWVPADGYASPEPLCFERRCPYDTTQLLETRASPDLVKYGIRQAQTYGMDIVMVMSGDDLSFVEGDSRFPWQEKLLKLANKLSRSTEPRVHFVHSSPACYIAVVPLHRPLNESPYAPSWSLVFQANAPPLGAAVYHVTSTGPTTPGHIARPPDEHATYIENKRYRVHINPHTGLISSIQLRISQVAVRLKHTFATYDFTQKHLSVPEATRRVRVHSRERAGAGRQEGQVQRCQGTIGGGDTPGVQSMRLASNSASQE